MPQVTAGGALGTLNVDVNNAIVPELDFTYMIRDDIGVELILGTSRHQVTSSIGGLGGVGVQVAKNLFVNADVKKIGCAPAHRRANPPPV